MWLASTDAMARMLCGFPSVAETWSSRESITCIGAVKERYFSDDWDDEDWDNMYSDEKCHQSPDVEHHRRKFEHIEDGFNKRWKEVVRFGRWLTADESRVAGWYKSGVTIGPEPKPIRTGATIHSICVTLGILASFKLHCRVYGGKSDEGLESIIFIRTRRQHRSGSSASTGPRFLLATPMLHNQIQ